MNHLASYLSVVKKQSHSLSSSVSETSDTVIELINSKFDYKSHLTGLLLGNVQSGKTAQLLGVLSKLADEGFELFILLTTDNVYLQKQTLTRAQAALTTFNVYGEEEDLAFLKNRLNKPILIVLKKNTNVLRKWRNLLSSSSYCSGRPIVIIDDEADAASLNTLVNRSDVSRINGHLTAVKELATSSLFLQVTATPQAVLLQSNISGWKPSFVHYFQPGSEYIGGEFIYSQPRSYCIEFTGEDELDIVKSEDSVIPEGLRHALMSYLVVCGHFKLKGIDTCNFLVHPSVRIADHQSFSIALGEHLNLLLLTVSDENEKANFVKELKKQWHKLQATKPDIESFDDILEKVIELIEQEKIILYKLNSTSEVKLDYEKGYNIIIGGNSLGRGVTFPRLQTVYYCRKAKSPQADTFWQHARMFGYDRDRGLLRVFLPGSLHRLFSELNTANRLLIEQIVRNDINDVQLIYPKDIKPTRSNVLDKKALNLIVGGVNFFASNPVEDNAASLDSLLKDFDDSESYHSVSCELLLEILKYAGDDIPKDWDNEKFRNSVAALSLKRPTTKYALILRRDRDISKGTGTLLSPTDRRIGDELHDRVVLTLYRVKGTADKGWKGRPFYIPNIKLPDGVCFYDTIDI